jgi:hypothetical protein
VSNAVNTVSFQPDLVWIKSRGQVRSHRLQDVIRGVGVRLSSNLTDADTSDASSLTAFNSNGFSLGTNVNYNTNAENFVAWNWKAGGTAVSNTAGTITSSVSANTTAGFSVVTYTGNGSTGTVGHGLGVVPSMVIVKSRTSTIDNWQVYHAILGNTQRIVLNLADAASSPSPGMWNSTSPTISVFSVGNQTGVNAATTYVAYCWAPVAGYSAFGSYTGNGIVDGPFIYTGFRPRWVLAKRTDAAESWCLQDSSRSPYNSANRNMLFAESADAEYTVGDPTDILSNGFKPRTAGTGMNASGGTYIYAAFAENPLKYANAR